MSSFRDAHATRVALGIVLLTARRYEPIAQAKHAREFCDACPKTLKWKLRAKVGDRVQWYELPEEVGH